MTSAHPARSARPAGPVLVARPAGRGAPLLALLTERGAAAEAQPLIELVAAETDELRTARAALAGGEYSHLVVTSRTAVEALGAVDVPAVTAVVAVGPGTAAALATAGISTAHVAAGSGAALVEEMTQRAPAAGARALFPASAAASRTVPEGLRAAGWQVHEVTAYRPRPLTPPPAVTDALAAGRFAAIVLTSPMIARRAAELGVHPSTAVVTIGDPTSEASRAAGLTVARQADEPTDEALAEAVVQVLEIPGAGAPPSAADPAADPRPSSASPKEPR